jgi:hypothetical protein
LFDILFLDIFFGRRSEARDGSGRGDTERRREGRRCGSNGGEEAKQSACLSKDHGGIYLFIYFLVADLYKFTDHYNPVNNGELSQMDITAEKIDRIHSAVTS